MGTGRREKVEKCRISLINWGLIGTYSLHVRTLEKKIWLTMSQLWAIFSLILFFFRIKGPTVPFLFLFFIEFLKPMVWDSLENLREPADFTKEPAKRHHFYNLLFDRFLDFLENHGL